MEEDEQFDLSQSFRQVYRLQSEVGARDELSLPTIDRRRGVRPTLNLIQRFLEQHPAEKQRIGL